MSVEYLAGDADAYERLLLEPNRKPPCDDPPYAYTHNFGGDPEKPFCAKTIARFWDARIVAEEDALPSGKLANVSIVSLLSGSLMYHGYKGIKHQATDAFVGTISGERHDDGAKDACENKDTLPCYHRVTFPWKDARFALKNKPFFFGPKITADVYGENKRNTVVVAHKIPSAKISSRASQTDKGVVPLYQIPVQGGMTITFRLTRDVRLVNISSVENAKRFLSWAGDVSKKQDIHEKWRELIDKASKPERYPPRDASSHLNDLDHDVLKKSVEMIHYRGYQKYGKESALISGGTIADVLGPKNDTYNIITDEDGQQRIKRVSYYHNDVELLRLVRFWLAHEGVKNEIDGWFWGGETWAACAKSDRVLRSQEFCFFDPRDLLEYVTHTEPKVHTLPDVPTYDEFWKKGTTAEDMEENIKAVVQYYPFF